MSIFQEDVIIACTPFCFISQSVHPVIYFLKCLHSCHVSLLFEETLSIIFTLRLSIPRKSDSSVSLFGFCCSVHAEGKRLWNSLPEGAAVGNGVQSHRGLLFCTRSSLSSQLHLQIQGDRGGGSETLVSARVSQRLLAGRSVAQVSITQHLTAYLDV